MSNILDAFSLAAGKISFQSKQTIQLILSHQGHSLNKECLIKHLGQLAALMTEFASAQLVFSRGQFYKLFTAVSYDFS
jgi:hypothetical protein